MFATFMRLLDAPQPAASSASALRGEQLFATRPAKPGVRCVARHAAPMVTPARSATPALESLTAHP